MEVLDPGQWHALRDAHERRAERLLAGVAERRRRGEKHPVEDFLFEYYTLRPGELARWHPGVGRQVVDPDGEFAGRRFHVVTDGVARLDVEAFVARRGQTVEWVRTLLSATARNPVHLGCFGMHEWAMVYRLAPDAVRHEYLPLRFDPDRIAEVTEQVGVRCSHFDAFRFFTPAAEPLNAIPGHDGRPTRERQAELDQGGCLHANMDLYKWAGKLVPAVGSELLLDCFELARDIRELDMRASAYDLADWGYPPVAVETPAGRAEYVRLQRGFAERAAVLRQRLLDVVADLPVTAASPTR